MTVNPFQHAEDEYFRLKGQLATGRITQAQFQAALKQLMIQDAQGRWWMLGAESSKWYVHDGQTWVEAQPSTLNMPLPPERYAPPPQQSRGANPVILLGAIGIILVCLLGAIGVGLAVNQGILKISLSQATNSPLPTFVPVPPTDTNIPIVASAMPLPSATTVLPSPTMPAPTSTPTDTPTVPPPTPTATATRTPTPSATPTPTLLPLPPGITFKFDDGVAQDQRDLIQNGVAMAYWNLGDAGAVTVFAYANFDALANDVDKYYNRSATSAASQTYRDMFSNGRWIANGGSGQISVWVSDTWKKYSIAYRNKSLIHEYFHNLQSSTSKKIVSATGPIWLYEGAADTAGYSIGAKLGLYDLAQVHNDRVSVSRGILVPLNTLITLDDSKVEDTEDSYTLGYLAVEYLLSPYGDDRLNVLRKFWTTQGAGASWQDAFKTTFGMTSDDFYSKFEAYRSAQFPPYCGTVGTLAQTNSAPFGIRFVRQLAPGDMPRLESPWLDPQTIPYIFCATGTQLPLLPSSAYKFPTGYGGWINCGANCLTVYMRPSTASGNYTMAIDLPDGRHAETTFQHQPITATSATATVVALAPTVTTTLQPLATNTLLPATPTPPIPAGLYVTAMGMDQPQPAHGQNVNFTVSFLNTANGVINVKWKVYVYRADNPTKSLTESSAVAASFAPGATLNQPVPMNFKLGSTGNDCDYLFARVDTLDSNNKSTDLTTTDGKVFEKGFSVCK